MFPGPSFQSDHQWRAEPDDQNIDHHLAVAVGKGNGKCGRLMGIVTEATNGNGRTNGVDGLVLVRCLPDIESVPGPNWNREAGGPGRKSAERNGRYRQAPPTGGRFLTLCHRISDL